MAYFSSQAIGIDIEFFTGPPGMVSTNYISSKSILISWEAPVMLQPDEDLQNYCLSCSSGSTTEVRIYLGPAITSFNVTNLKPDTTYTCCVMAITTAGMSPHVCIRSSTLEDGKGRKLCTSIMYQLYSCPRIAWSVPGINMCPGFQEI